jgi:hypothetical protein
MKPKKIKFHSPRRGEIRITPSKAKPQLVDTPPRTSHHQTPHRSLRSLSEVEMSEACPERSRRVETTDLTDWTDAQIVMQLLHISPRTLQTLRTNGTLPFSRIRGKIYYRKTDIQKILSDNYTMYKLNKE